MYPGVLVHDEMAMEITNRFRKVFHHGPPERMLPSALIERFRSQKSNLYTRLPEDIKVFRQEHYEDIMYSIPPMSACLMLTWIVLPESTITTTHHIFSHSLFHTYSTVYLSVWSVGDAVYETTPKEVQAFFSDEDRPQNKDFYVFDPDCAWCIAVNHDDQIFIAGKNSIF